MPTLQKNSVPISLKVESISWNSEPRKEEITSALEFRSQKLALKRCKIAPVMESSISLTSITQLVLNGTNTVYGPPSTKLTNSHPSKFSQLEVRESVTGDRLETQFQDRQRDAFVRLFFQRIQSSALMREASVSAQRVMCSMVENRLKQERMLPLMT